MPGMHVIKAEDLKHELSFSGSLWLPGLPGALNRWRLYCIMQGRDFSFLTTVIAIW